MSNKMFITDFDGTMTRFDFYRLAVERFVPADCPDYWLDYRQGRLTHFDALNKYFKAIRASEEQILEMLEQMELEPRLPECIEDLREAGWSVVVTSAGCEWYIDKLFAKAGVQLEVHANPGTFESSTGLVMRRPLESPFHSQELGIDKAKIVWTAIQQGNTVAFAGDGYPDADAARLVPDNLRFARSDLASQLLSEKLGFKQFDRWSEVAEHLVNNY